jgi:hypothetical protein
MSYCSEGARSGGAGGGERSVTLRWRKRLDNGDRRVHVPGASVLPDRAAGLFPLLSYLPDRN